MARPHFLAVTFLTLALALAGCGDRDPLASLTAGEEGRVVRIIDGDSLVLDTGLSVRLVGIEAPSFGRQDDPDQPFSEEARRQLEDLTIGRRVRLYYPGLTRDRYDRALAHIATIDGRGPKLWINRELVKRGTARVRAYPDTARLTEDLLAIEAVARTDRIGLWREAAYSPVSASEIAYDYKGFVLVQAQLANPLPTDRPGQRCAYGLEGASLRLIADPTAPLLCGLPPLARLRVRGYAANGRLYLTHDSNIEVLDMPGSGG